MTFKQLFILLLRIFSLVFRLSTCNKGKIYKLKRSTACAHPGKTPSDYRDRHRLWTLWPIGLLLYSANRSFSSSQMSLPHFDFWFPFSPPHQLSNYFLTQAQVLYRIYKFKSFFNLILQHEQNCSLQTSSWSRCVGVTSD